MPRTASSLPSPARGPSPALQLEEGHHVCRGPQHVEVFHVPSIPAKLIMEVGKPRRRMGEQMNQLHMCCQFLIAIYCHTLQRRTCSRFDFSVKQRKGAQSVAKAMLYVACTR